MRRRITIIFLFLIALTVLSLAVPLAIETARANTQLLLLDRQADTEQFAEHAEVALHNGRLADLTKELRSYQELYGIRVLVLRRDGGVLTSSAPGLTLDPVTAEPATTALFGRRATSTDVVWPWNDEPFVVALPLFLDGDGAGAVLTISPTSEIRVRTLDRWTLLAIAGVVTMALAFFLVEPAIRWILRPVRALRRAAASIAAGELTARADFYSGPPELRSLAETFNVMGETIERLMERQRAFVSFASHQLRTPLAVLRLHLEGLTLDHPSIACSLRDCLDEVDRLTSVCDGLLAFCRAESETMVPCQEDVGAVATDRVEAWRSLAQRRDVSLSRTGKDSLIAESGLGILTQVLDALIDNAIKYSGPGGNVAVHVEATGRWAEIRVVDDGPGMPAEARAKATQPFWRSSENQDIPGSGLGLTICATLISQVGGQLDLLEARPHGLEARIRLRQATDGALNDAGGRDNPN